MSEARIQIRRSRRTDFTAVMQLLAASNVAVPPPERATLRRFRGLVTDLGTDFYLALLDGAVAGLVHMSYARQLARPPVARLEQLLVAEAARRRGIGSALLSFAQRRAHRRGCGSLSCAVPPGSPVASAFLRKAGLQSNGEWVCQELHPAA